MRSAALLLALLAAAPQEPATTTVGMPARIRELVLPGPELEVAPGEADDPLVLRVLGVYPHGTAHRYDLEVWAYEPGDYDLSTHLRRKDGAPLEPGALPAVPLRVASVLPPGQVTPNDPAHEHPGRVGGYRLLWIAGGVLWVAGLFAILFVGRKKRREEAERAARPRTLAERLRPLVVRAVDGELSRTERAELELSLVAWWRRRLGLEAERPEAALATLHEHADAGPLLRGLEEWLHRPAPAQEADVDVGALLAPYRDLPADAIELPDGGAPRS